MMMKRMSVRTLNSPELHEKDNKKKRQVLSGVSLPPELFLLMDTCISFCP
jgi:hypothetical protein